MPPRRGTPRGRGGSQISSGPTRSHISSTGTGSHIAPASATTHQSAAHVTTIGVKRPGYGKSGKECKVVTNHFELRFDCPIIHHYDGPLMKELYQTLKLQHPALFGPLAFDGRKNLYSPSRLPFENDTQEYHISLQPQTATSRPSKVYRIRFSKTHQEINPEVLRNFVSGRSSHDADVTVATNALNVVLSMFPSENKRFASNARSFFVPEGNKNIGQGLTLWRGFFQSIRPAASRMTINIDISTGLMYSPGPLINLCLDFLQRPGNLRALEAPMPEPERRALSKFIAKLRIHTTHNKELSNKARTIKALVETSAITTKFTVDNVSQTVQQYYESTYNKRLQYPKLLTSGATLPLEICEVFEGQLRGKAQPPSSLTKDVVEFATKKPAERLANIKSALQLLGYGQSPYLRAFHLEVADQPIAVPARTLPPPNLTYAANKTLGLKPGVGAWDMSGHRFWKPGTVKGWVVVVFSKPHAWPMQKIREVAGGLSQACTAVGIVGFNASEPLIEYADPAKDIKTNLMNVGIRHNKEKGFNPSLLILILPPGSSAIYRAIKHFGDVEIGVATQCMMETKCYKGRFGQGGSPAGPSYFSNVALKVNAKLGGINVVPDTKQTGGILGDANNPVLIMGADAIHPPPDSQGRPSYTAVVGSIDSMASKYVASCRPQTSKQEMIDDLEEMTKEILHDFQGYRSQVEGKPGMPKRIFMFRDGVSEGQFQQVIDNEIPKLKAACKSFNIEPKITFVIVGKRHHTRLFPESSTQADRTGNCLAGTVIDQGITSPTEFDYFLQSHAGLLGTSRPAHYNVLLDENNMTPDALQQLTYTLCHIYARSTRSVSIPAPTYYADIVCSRSANHYDPKGPYQPDSIDHASSGSQRLKDAKTYFKPAHRASRMRMYFM
ncbi:hypothetical protein FRB99_002683 [Tulasnella sp. 403]|nr:hypothetical protein FRB99_002683 [Tulasnella sp. 403]